MLYLGPLAFFGAYLYARFTGAPRAWQRMLGWIAGGLLVLAYLGGALGSDLLEERLRLVITVGILGGLVLAYRVCLRALRARIAGETPEAATPPPEGPVLIVEDGALARDVAQLAQADGVPAPAPPLSLLKRDEAGEILATCRAHIDGPVVTLSGAWVAPSARRRGEARALVATFLAECKSRGAVEALALTGTPPANALARAAGFEPLRAVPQDAPERILWRKTL